MAGVESSSGNMDENGEAAEVRQRSESFPIALMALPVKPQSTWTLEPEHAQNILGGQVSTWHPMHHCLTCTSCFRGELAASLVVKPELAKSMLSALVRP